MHGRIELVITQLTLCLSKLLRSIVLIQYVLLRRCPMRLAHIEWYYAFLTRSHTCALKSVFPIAIYLMNALLVGKDDYSILRRRGPRQLLHLLLSLLVDE